LFIINREIQKLIDVKHYDIKIICKLVSITDLDNLNDIFNEHKPQQVFHAAAYKHVSLVEKNPIESIKNNVIGTLNIVDCAINYNVSRFLFISTDKAVKPTTIMGKTKRLGEKIIKEKVNDKKCNTIFSIVRFGNVLGSSGSVIPLFIEQIENGGPITLTHKDIKRYFMTIEDAVSLVLEASQFAKGGEIYLLDMGKSIKIYDLALKLINLSGLTLKDRNNPDGDIEIKITGLDPIEKLDEELIIAGSTKKTINPSIFEVDADISIQENFFTKINEIKSSLVLENKKHVLNLLNSLNLN
jgi:FlaA1/EpsC-like NDP-sugar epimerase